MIGHLCEFWNDLSLYAHQLNLHPEYASSLHDQVKVAVSGRQDQNINLVGVDQCMGISPSIIRSVLLFI